MNKILVVPDTHFPYSLKSFFKDLEDVIETYKPTTIVHIGDLIDSQAISHHLPNPNSPTAVAELESSKEDIVKLIKIIGKRPVYLCVGNHDRRYIKMAADVRIPAIYLKSFAELLGLPKSWKIANEHVVDGIYFTHGKSQIPGKTAHSYGMPTVEGHWHANFSINYYSSGIRTIWSAYCGAYLDDASFAASYAANNLRRSIPGFLLISDGIPTLIPF